MNTLVRDPAVEHLPGRLSPELARLLAAIDAEIGPQPDTTMLPPAEGRALAARLNQRWNGDLPAMAAVSEIVIPADPVLASADCRVKVLIPPQSGDGALLFVHGGGFAFCSPETHERCARVLAAETGLPVLLPDYRLAPEHPFPAGLHDVVACLGNVFESTAALGIRPGPLLVAGDSAGANLALAALLFSQTRERKPVDGALLFYGVYDADFETPSYQRFAEGPGLTTGRMQRYWDWYLADKTARTAPLAAPLRAGDEALRALPPLFLLAAEIDPLLSDTLNFAARLRALGRPAEMHVVEGVTHGFLQMTLHLAAARDGLKTAAAAAKAMITSG
ncbi:alpha/beta hydrolase [Labrys miyagiensis]|uniref:Alpha/beta hydrolase n=1 Tax=Labrys miyagiensis TaxID=346912 RepID=A0ABQ6CIB2_9HYPH|nr:alpha/beta hydrolase [Labrys miyagiensis]GLS18449.1 alpha/beta hydrolase [Labrys miyagiensis]